jgi:predicted DNA-binding protein (MmcQ/YjbR family)
MKTRTASHLAAAIVSTFLLIAIVTMVRADSNSVPGWNPDAWASESTMQIMTTSPEGEEHWSTLWVVVIDHKLYARLGNRSYDRIQKNKTIPWVKLKIDDKQFDKVLLETAPEMVDPVAKAMAQKYWLDMLVRYEEHPLTARLIAQPTAPPPPPPAASK